MAASSQDKLMEVGIATATTLDANYTINDTSITVASTSGWPTATGVAFAIDVVDSNGVQVPGTYNEYVGVVSSATSITSVDHVNGTDRNYSAGATTRVYIPVSAERENRIVDWGLVEHDQDGTHSDITATSITATTGTFTNLTIAGTASAEGWSPLGATPNTVTANGNRSYDLVFNGTDLTDTITEGMRVRTARTVAAPTYMGGAFNGTTHYFTKTSPTSTLSTVTNNFSLKATIEPSAYAVGYIQGRGDATSANGLFLRMNADGTVSVGVSNAGVLNYRIVTTYQSLPLNKKTKVWATWASGTGVILFDGVSVPVAAAVTGGTAPTTAGTGGDFSIGRWGAYSSGYFTGYISDVGVFNAVLAEATMRSYDSQALTGAETNCIGAWSLNNTGVNQQAPGTNDLTATGGVGYSNRSPYGNNGVSTTIDYGVVMAKSFSTNTTLTVQVPEGCTIPTSGGVATVDYSINDVPYGFPRDKGRWTIQNTYLTRGSQSSPATNTAYNFAGRQMTIPIGKWIAGYDSAIYVNSTGAAVNEGRIDLNTAPATYTVTSPFAQAAVYSGNNSIEAGSNVSKRAELSLTTATTYYLNYRYTTNGVGVMIADLADFSPLKIVAENAYI